MVNERNKSIGRFFLLMMIVIWLTFLLSNFIGLSRSGFDSNDILSLQTFYIIGGILAFGIVCAFVYQKAIKKGDTVYGESVGFISLGKEPHAKFFERFTILQISWIFLILFLILGLLSASSPLTQKTFTGVGTLEQQFSKTDSVVYSALLIPGAENLGSAFLVALVLIGLGYVARQYKWKKPNYKIAVYSITPLVMMLFGVGNHALRYGGSTVDLGVVAVFWFIGGLLTVATGLFTPFWIMHIMNNLVFDLSRYLDSYVIVLYFIGAIVMLVLGYFAVYKGRLFGSKKPKTLEF